MSDANTERPSGACTIPSRAIRYGLHAGDVDAVEEHRARGRRDQSPDQTRAIVVLPAPFDAEQRDHLRPAGTENDTPKSARNGP